MKQEVIIHLQNAVGVKADGIIGPITRDALFDKLLTIAEDEIGVKEVANTNCGVRVNQYKAATVLKPTASWPWCSAFICWIIKEAGIFTESNRPKTASAFNFEDWGHKMGLDVIKDPPLILKGDIVIYKFSHIGIAEWDSYKNGSFSAIEGNTNDAGSREGGSVMRKTRRLSSVRSVIRF